MRFLLVGVRKYVAFGMGLLLTVSACAVQKAGTKHAISPQGAVSTQRSVNAVFGVVRRPACLLPTELTIHLPRDIADDMMVAIVMAEISRYREHRRAVGLEPPLAQAPAS